MLPELEPYIARYYDRWLNYSQYICTRWNIRREAYDIMADVLVEFCCKPDEFLFDLLTCEQQGGHKLLNCVVKAIRFRAVDFIYQPRMTMIFRLKFPTKCAKPKRCFGMIVS